MIQFSSAQYRFNLHQKEEKKQLSMVRLQCDDKWLGADKFQHGIAVFQASFFMYLLSLNSFDQSKQQSLNVAIASGTGISIIKEIWDSRKKENHFCFKDLTADAAGLLLMIFIKDV
ncbi:MAG: hypothetical protein Kow00108_24750 [Calditrichia bacterium]